MSSSSNNKTTMSFEKFWVRFCRNTPVPNLNALDPISIACIGSFIQLASKHVCYISGTGTDSICCIIPYAPEYTAILSKKGEEFSFIDDLTETQNIPGHYMTYINNFSYGK